MALVLAAMIPLVIFAAIMVRELGHQQRTISERQLGRETLELAASLDQEIVAAVKVLEAIGQSELLRRGDLRMFHAETARIKATQPSWLTILVHSPAGECLLNAGRAWGEGLFPLADPDSFHTLQRTGKAAIGNSASGILGFPVRIPITIDGRFAYVLTAVISADALQRLVEPAAPTKEEWARAIIDEHGTIAARFPQPRKYQGKAATALFLAEARTKDNGIMRHRTAEGKNTYVSVARAPFSGWITGIAVPVEVLDAPATRAIVIVTSVGTALLAAFGGLAFFYARGLARRIQALAQDAQGLAKGSSPVGSRSRVIEVEALQSALTQSAALLKARERERDDLLSHANAARADAEAANQAKDRFLAMLGHELRNPLGAISNGVFLLKELLPKDPDLTSIQDIIERQLKHLARLLDDLLDASRISRGKVTLKHEVVDLGQLVEELRHDFAPRFAKAGVTLAALVPAERLLTWGDRTRLSQCLSNLLHNALKFTRQGGHVQVTLAAMPGQARISVTDDGIGINPEILSTLFQAFVQGPQSLDRQGGGLGLGLAVVRSLVELHGGTVDAESEGRGKGATMVMTLPLKKSNQGTAKGAETSFPEPGKPKRVLIIEDIADVAESLRMALAKQGHSTHVAGTGLAGIQTAQLIAPDAIICDIGLPDIDGYEVCRRLHQTHSSSQSSLSSRPDMPRFIALTGYGQKSDIEAAFAAGFDHHLTKPVDLQALLRLLSAPHEKIRIP